ncbi:hypothetical protein D3C81_1817310 [compost metagenome]
METFCFSSALRLRAFFFSTADRSSTSAISSTRARTLPSSTPWLRNGNARLSNTVMVSYTTGNWNTWAMLRACGDSALTGLPSNSTSP